MPVILFDFLCPVVAAAVATQAAPASSPWRGGCPPRHWYLTSRRIYIKLKTFKMHTIHPLCVHPPPVLLVASPATGIHPSHLTYLHAPTVSKKNAPTHLTPTSVFSSPRSYVQKKLQFSENENHYAHPSTHPSIHPPTTSNYPVKCQASLLCLALLRQT